MRPGEPVAAWLPERESGAREGEPAERESAAGGEAPSAPVLREFAKLDIVVMAPDEEDIARLVRELQRLRARVRRIWPLPDLIPVEADLILSDYRAGLAERLPWLPGQAPAALVLMIPAHQSPDVKGLADCAPHGLLARPLNMNVAIAGLALARSQALYEQRLRSRIDKLDDNLRTMRSVERAKQILMTAKNMSEEEAYHFLRRHAMERRVSIGALATVIVDSQELLG